MSDLLSVLKQALRDRYVVEREAGRGGMATVFQARDRKLGREVAIKVVSPSVMTAVAGERFLREIRITAQLQHPNILSLIDSGEATARRLARALRAESNPGPRGRGSLRC